MPNVIFTDNLKRHIDCPPQQVDGNTVRLALDQCFQQNPNLRSYILDDQDRLRTHMLIIIDGNIIQDRNTLSDAVKPESEIYVLQALSGG